MNTFFGRIIVTLSLLCCSAAEAQQVGYSLADQNGQRMGSMTFNYTATGYEAVRNGEQITVETTGTITVTTMGKVAFLTESDGSYWHKQMGAWRNLSAVTSSGSTGGTRMLYIGPTSDGNHLYHEELWMNRNLVIQSYSIVDSNNQIVWSMTANREGIFYLTRMPPTHPNERTLPP